MRFVGIDIASEHHVVAILNESGKVLLRPTTFTEDHEGHEKLLKLLGDPKDLLLVMEATGHYWQNLFAWLLSKGVAVALINPLRARRFAQVDLERTKTDSIDALSLARFALEKRPAKTPLLAEATQELRELVRLRDRLVQDLGDRTRQLHRIVDLGFPEFTRSVKDLSSPLATTLLHTYPTAKAVRSAGAQELADLKVGSSTVGLKLADELVAAATKSVGRHHGTSYQLQARYFCEDIVTLRTRLAQLDRDIEQTLERHEVGKLLTTIDGVGTNTAARLVAELGDIEKFESAKAIAAYVGVVPGLAQSGKKTSARAGLSPIGHAKLRAKLWLPTLTAVRLNPWLKPFYERLVAEGKEKKVALVAAMRKLLGAVYSVAKNKRAFVPRVATAVEATP